MVKAAAHGLGSYWAGVYQCAPRSNPRRQSNANHATLIIDPLFFGLHCLRPLRGFSSHYNDAVVRCAYAVVASSEIPSGWEFQRLLNEADRVSISSYKRRPISTLAGLQIAPIRKGGCQKLLGKLYSGPAILCQPFPPSRPDQLYWRSVVRHNCSRQSKHAFRLQLAAGCMSCTLAFDRQCLRTLCMCARGSDGP